MSDSLEATLKRIAHDNQAARSRFAALNDRTVSAIVAGDWEKLSQVVHEVSNDGDGDDKTASGDVPAASGTSGLSTMEA